MRVVELFAGCGGAALGLERAGMRHQLCVEWDTAACTTLQHAGLPALCHDIARPLPFELDPLPDAIWASPPCQAWSAAGKRLGAQDERNGWPATFEWVDRLRPRWLMCENVPGMLSHSTESACLNHGPRMVEGSWHRAVMLEDRSVLIPLDAIEAMPSWLTEREAFAAATCARCYWDLVVLEEARRRFAWVGFRVINASCHGVPQHRRRVYLICGPRRIRWPAPTHCDPRHGILLAAGLKPWRTAGEALGLDSGSFDDERGSGMCERHGERRNPGVDEPAPTLRARSHGASPLTVIGYNRGRDDGARMETHGLDQPACALRGSPGGSTQPFVIEPLGHPEWASSVDEPAPAQGCKGNAYLSIPKSQIERMERYEKASGCKTARTVIPETPSRTVSGRNAEGSTNDALCVPGGEFGRRRITVRETLRLMAIPDDWPLFGTKTQRYAQAGNACCPPVVEALGRAVMVADAGR